VRDGRDVLLVVFRVVVGRERGCIVIEAAAAWLVGRRLVRGARAVAHGGRFICCVVIVIAADGGGKQPLHAAHPELELGGVGANDFERLLVAKNESKDRESLIISVTSEPVDGSTLTTMSLIYSRGSALLRNSSSSQQKWLKVSSRKTRQKSR